MATSMRDSLFPFVTVESFFFRLYTNLDWLSRFVIYNSVCIILEILIGALLLMIVTLPSSPEIGHVCIQSTFRHLLNHYSFQWSECIKGSVQWCLCRGGGFGGSNGNGHGRRRAVVAEVMVVMTAAAVVIIVVVAVMVVPTAAVVHGGGCRTAINL